MEFEPFILGGFESRVQIGLNPFEPAISTGFEPRVQIGLNPSNDVRFNYLGRHLTGKLTRKLTVLCNNTARTTLLIVARAVWLVLKTATAQVILSRQIGGPN